MAVRESDVIQALKDKLLDECQIHTGMCESPESLLELLRRVTLVERRGEVRHGYAARSGGNLFMEHWYECPETAAADAAVVMDPGSFKLVPVAIVVGPLEDEIDPASLDEDDQDEADDAG